MRNFLDGAASICAALVTLVICGIPAWYTIQAVRADIAPVWAYGAAGALTVIGLVLVLAFGRKAFAGVAPTRQRRR